MNQFCNYCGSSISGLMGCTNQLCCMQRAGAQNVYDYYHAQQQVATNPSTFEEINKKLDEIKSLLISLKTSKAQE